MYDEDDFDVETDDEPLSEADREQEAYGWFGLYLLALCIVGVITLFVIGMTSGR